MAKLTPNIPYEDLGDRHQIAEFSAAWVMESSESFSYLALSDFRPERCRLITLNHYKNKALIACPLRRRSKLKAPEPHSKCQW